MIFCDKNHRLRWLKSSKNDLETAINGLGRKKRVKGCMNGIETTKDGLGITETA